MALPAQSGLLSLLGTPNNDTMSWITSAARETIAGVDFVSISVAHIGGYFETVGSTDPLALKADALQYELLEGPCFDAAVGTPLAHSNDVAADARWPRYAAQAGELGIRAQAGFALHSGNRTLGGLNLYSTTPGTLDPAALELASRFAAEAASAMELRLTVDTLTDALVARKSIGQAMGIVMERFGLDDERAFQYLVRVSQTSNVKLRVVAKELVEQANEDRSG